MTRQHTLTTHPATHGLVPIPAIAGKRGAVCHGKGRRDARGADVQKGCLGVERGGALDRTDVVDRRPELAAGDAGHAAGPTVIVVVGQTGAGLRLAGTYDGVVAIRWCVVGASQDRVGGRVTHRRERPGVGKAGPSDGAVVGRELNIKSIRLIDPAKIACKYSLVPTTSPPTSAVTQPGVPCGGFRVAPVIGRHHHIGLVESRLAGRTHNPRRIADALAAKLWTVCGPLFATCDRFGRFAGGGGCCL